MNIDFRKLVAAALVGMSVCPSAFAQSAIPFMAEDVGGWHETETVEIPECKYVTTRVDQYMGAKTVESIIKQQSGAIPSCLYQRIDAAASYCSSQGFGQSGADGHPNWDNCMIDQTFKSFGNPMQGGYPVPWYESDFWLDNSCNLVLSRPAGADDSCRVVFHLFHSPISLIWEEGYDLEQDVRLTTFQLNPGSIGRTYLWKASRQAPLVVYDPKHRGEITSATQLFGEWTFGGRVSASAAGSVALPWNDGFEALATLDRDGNGRVDGGELEPLGLWFDANRDGVSQPGEVLPARQVGLLSLATRYDRREPTTRSLISYRGFERAKNGVKVAGRAIDWYSPQASDATELVTEAAQSAAAVTGQLRPEFQSAAAPAQINPLKGLWRWAPGSKLGSERKSSGGFMVFQPREDGSFDGASIAEMHFKTLPKTPGTPARSVRQQIRKLAGKTEIGDAGQPTYRFRVLEQNRDVAETVASIDSEGMLRGTTTIKRSVNGREGVLKYDWTAKKL